MGRVSGSVLAWTVWCFEHNLAPILWIGVSEVAVIIDDFQTGPHQATLIAGEDRSAQSGAGIVGGLRNTWVGFISNPFGTPVTLDVGTNGLIIGTGPQAGHRLELAYGLAKDWTHGPRLGLALTPFESLVVRFAANDVPLAFNIYLMSNTSTGLQSFHWATHVNRSGDLTIPLAGLSTLGEQADLARIDIIWMIFFPALLGGNDYAVSSIEAVS